MKTFRAEVVVCVVFYVIVSQGDFADAIVSGMVDSVASATAAVSNTVASLSPTILLTDVGTSLGDGALRVATQGRVQDASSYTSFLLFSRELQDKYNKVDEGDVDISLKGFSVDKPTKILIHGWSTNGTDAFPSNMTKAFLAAEDVNVISVNWPRFAQQMYTVAYTAVPYVAAYTASFIDFLVQDVGVDISTIHVVGYSLGAHIAGIVGENILCGRLPRISGLDPAGPLFTSSTNGSLDASDADFVDVIHTSGGTVGYKDPCGTVDFYPNGGYAPQAGCSPLDPFCSHGLAYLFYAESLASNGFKATKCSSWKSYEKGECAGSETAVMGYHVDKGSRGVFYLKTNSKSPYAMW